LRASDYSSKALTRRSLCLMAITVIKDILDAGASARDRQRSFDLYLS
jgi:hypothetical protein